MTKMVKLTNNFVYSNKDDDINFLKLIIDHKSIDKAFCKIKNAFNSRCKQKDYSYIYHIEIYILYCLEFISFERDFKFLNKIDFDYIKYSGSEFCQNFRRLYHGFSDEGKSDIKGKLVDGLKSDGGLCSLDFEIFLAAFFQNKGFKVLFNEYELSRDSEKKKKNRNFDLTLKKENITVCLDAKCIFSDSGLNIKNDLFERICETFLKAIPRNRENKFKNSIIFFEKIGQFDSFSSDIEDFLIACAKEILPNEKKFASECIEISCVSDDFFYASNTPLDINRIVNETIQQFSLEKIGKKIENVFCSDAGWGYIPICCSAAKKQTDGILNRKNTVENLKNSAKRQLFGEENPFIAINIPNIPRENEELFFDKSKKQNIYQSFGMLAKNLFESKRACHLSGVILFGQMQYKEYAILNNFGEGTIQGFRNMIVALNENNEGVRSGNIKTIMSF